MNSNRPTFLKRRYFVLPRIQTLILAYSIALATVWSLLGVIIQTTISTFDFDSLSLAMIVSCILSAAAMSIFMGVLLTHRIAGPIYRLKSEMNRISEGGELREVKTRDGDYLEDVVVEYNRMVDQIRSKGA